MGKEASTVAAIVNMPPATLFALSASKHIFPNARRLVWIGNSILFLFIYFIIFFKKGHLP